jgi:hypothetical protein
MAEQEEREIKLFFEIKLTKYAKGAEIISFGVISEKGDSFYFENLFYRNRKEIAEANFLRLPLGEDFRGYIDTELQQGVVCVKTLNWESELSETFRQWLSAAFGHTKVRFYGVHTDYKWTTLCNLFGGVFDLPTNVERACVDTIAYNGLLNLSYDVFAENVLWDLSPKQDILRESNDNALWKARVLKKLHTEVIRRLNIKKE